MRSKNPERVTRFIGREPSGRRPPACAPACCSADRSHADRFEEKMTRLVAKLRTLVKRILRKYGYPPDKQEKATQTVLEQAELLCHDWAA